MRIGLWCWAAVVLVLLQSARHSFVVAADEQPAGDQQVQEGAGEQGGDSGTDEEVTGFKFRGREWHPESFGYTNCSKPIPTINEDANIFGCRVLRNVCLDQGVVIYQDSRYHPWTSDVRLPFFNVTDILWNTPSVLGIGDKWKIGKNRYQMPLMRPWHHMEESDDVRQPVFSKCTTPLLFFHHFPFNVAEVYRFAVNNIYFLQQRLKFFDDHITLVPATPPMSRVPAYTKFWLQPFSRYAVTSLGALSQRLPPGGPWPSNATGEGTAVRCFAAFVMCKITLKKPTAAYFAAGQYVAEYYMEKAKPLEVEYTARLAASVPPAVLRNDTILKVVFAVRSKSHKDIGRVLLNEDDLIDRCNRQEARLPTDPGISRFASVYCFRHVFGVDNLYDMWLVRQLDVLVGVHGSALTNAMFMRRGSSLIELRPFGFSGRESWPNIYMKAQTRGMEVFWFGIDVMNETLSTPGDFEADMQPFYTRARGCLARDRNLVVPWPALAAQLVNVAVVGRSKWRYKVLRYSHAYYLTHDLQPVELRGKDRRVPIELQTWFTSLDEERRRAAAIPLTPEGEAAAQAAEEELMAKIHEKREAEAEAKAAKQAAEREQKEKEEGAAGQGEGADATAEAQDGAEQAEKDQGKDQDQQEQQEQEGQQQGEGAGDGQPGQEPEDAAQEGQQQGPGQGQGQAGEGAEAAETQHKPHRHRRHQHQEGHSRHRQGMQDHGAGSEGDESVEAMRERVRRAVQAKQQRQEQRREARRRAEAQEAAVAGAGVGGEASGGQTGAGAGGGEDARAAAAGGGPGAAAAAAVVTAAAVGAGSSTAAAAQ